MTSHEPSSSGSTSSTIHALSQLCTLPPSQSYQAISTPSSPQHTSASLASPSPVSPAAASNSFTIKAVRQDSIVLIRGSPFMLLSDVRSKIREKFASQEGIILTDSFTIGFNPVITAAEPRSKASIRSRPRSQSLSAMKQIHPQPRLRFLIYEEDWQQVAASCSGKMTLHVFDRF